MKTMVKIIRNKEYEEGFQVEFIKNGIHPLDSYLNALFTHVFSGFHKYQSWSCLFIAFLSLESLIEIIQIIFGVHEFTYVFENCLNRFKLS